MPKCLCMIHYFFVDHKNSLGLFLGGIRLPLEGKCCLHNPPSLVIRDAKTVVN